MSSPEHSPNLPSGSFSLPTSRNYQFVREQVVAQIQGGQVDIPILPESAARVVALATSAEADAQQLSKLITSDPGLATHVMRVASSAAYMRNNPINSLQQAITRMGFAEVANIAFTVAVQGKLLNAPGQLSEVRAMWSEAVCAGMWGREIAGQLDMDQGTLYLCGLLHEIGKPIVLQAVADVVQRTRTPLEPHERTRLMNEYQGPVGRQVVEEWKLPAPVVAAVGYWDRPAVALTYQRESTVIGLAHWLAAFALNDKSESRREALLVDQRATALGLKPEEMEDLLSRTERVLGQTRTF